MTHEAHIVEGSIEDLGTNGIAFSIICCEEPNTIHRHTVQHSHTMTDDELRALLTRYVKQHARLHLATTRNHARVVAMTTDKGVCGVCSHE